LLLILNFALEYAIGKVQEKSDWSWSCSV
jgi:hypothetical protein